MTRRLPILPTAYAVILAGLGALAWSAGPQTAEMARWLYWHLPGVHSLTPLEFAAALTVWLLAAWWYLAVRLTGGSQTIRALLAWLRPRLRHLLTSGAGFSLPRLPPRTTRVYVVPALPAVTEEDTAPMAVIRFGGTS
jgi:hypothetical protein